jgi:hypothetical protein
MWYLKYKYKHSDCIYAPKLQELNLNGYFYYLGEYVKGDYVYTSAMLHLIGEEKAIKRYIRYIKNHKDVVNLEVYENLIFILAKHKKELSLYEAVYNPILIYPAPAYLGKEGFEVIEVASWDRKAIQNLISSIEKNKTTTYFEILQFKEKVLEEVYVSRLMPKLASKQKEAITIAFRNGYYNFPRKINLDELAKSMKVSKQTFRENLRKAEAKIIPKFISE